MIAPGIVARPSRCLRCQLRHVLLQARIRRLPQTRQSIYEQRNAFSTQPRRVQEADDQVVAREKKPYKWKHLNSFIGRPGRRQRVLSERLKTDSLDKPANVIVLKDLQEEPTQLSTRLNHLETDDAQRPKAVTAKEIENAINNRYIAPAEAEVNASIEALRPEGTVVEEKEFQKHKNGLLKGYTFQQLSRYLVYALQASATDVSLGKIDSIEGDVQELGTTAWHQGETPLRIRRPKGTKKNKTYTKDRLVEQILRLAWHLTIQSELQGLGELEVKLRSWQASMLFDLMHNDQPYYRTFIQSSGLLGSPTIELHRPDHVMRVTGRRQDAEDVARQLKLGLLGVERFDFDLEPFSRILAKENTRQANDLFTKDELDYVSDLTKCVIRMRKTGIASIYGRTESARHKARRLLLALLNLPDTWIVKETLPGVARLNDARITRVPVDISGLHRCHRGVELFRKVVDGSASKGNLNASRRNGDAQVEAQSGPALTATRSLESMVKKVTMSIRRMEAASRPLRAGSSQADSSSYWLADPRYTDWKVDFGRLLYFAGQQQSPSKDQKASKANVKPDGVPQRSIVQHQVPGYSTVLSYFEASDRTSNTGDISQAANAKRPRLVAHFVPSPSPPIPDPLLVSKYPKLEMHFELSFVSRELLLTQVQAIMDEQCLEVPLPEQTNDLFLSRRLVATARLDLAEKDDSVRTFISELQKSAQSNDGTLAAPPELEFRLPRWMLKDKNSKKSGAREHHTAKYLFERFEQVQSVPFKSRQRLLEREIDEDVKRVIQDMPRTMSIDYREVEGGAIYGSRTLVGLRNDLQHSLPNDQSSDAVEPDASEMTELALLASSTAATDTRETPDSAQAQQRPQHQATPEVDEDGQTVKETDNGSLPPKQSGDMPNRVTDLVTMALSFANLFTRAASGSLRQYGRGNK